MRKIWKYDLPLHGPSRHLMARGAKILAVGEQDKNPVIWAEVEVDSEGKPKDPIYRIFVSAFTGDFAPSSAKHVGTVTIRAMRQLLVVHVYDLGEASPSGEAIPMGNRGSW